MNICKRILCAFLALCLILCPAPVSVGAAGGAAVTVTTARAYAGNDVCVYIDASGLESLASLDLEIYYDSAAMSVSSTADGGLLSGGICSVNTATVGVIRLSAAWVSGISGDGRLLTVWFRVADDCAPGDYPVRVAVGEAYDASLNPVSVSGSSGAVTVVERPQTTREFTVYSTASAQTLRQGDTVTLRLVNQNYMPFAGLDVSVEYDSDLFEPVGLTLEEALQTEGAIHSVNTSTRGLVKFSYASVEAVQTMFLATLELKVIADTEAETAVRFSVNEAYDLDLTPYSCAGCSTALTLTTLPPVVDLPDLTVSGGSVDAGETFTAVLSLEAGAAVAAADFTVRYDPAVFRCCGVTAAADVAASGGMAVISPNRDDGLIRFSYINESGYDGGLDLIQITLEALTSPESHYLLTPGGSDVVDKDYAAVALDLVAGSGCVYEVTGQPATCTEGGTTVYRCAACGDSRPGEEIPALGHHFEDGSCVRCGRIPDTVASGWSGSTTWVLTEDGVLTFTGPGSMRNYTYKSEMPWYGYFDWITRVVLNEGVTSIGSYAFYGMPCLESIEIPGTVTTIGDYAFKNAAALKDVVLPAGLTRLGESAFYGCSALSAIEIPASLWTVQPYTFKNCTALAAVTFHEGNLQKISDGAFYNTALTEVVLPDCLDILDVYVFKNCAALANVTLGSGLTQIREAVLYGTAISAIEIPAGVTVIKPYAFKNCTRLTSVELPSTLTAVEEAAFYACTALESVELPDAVTKIGNYAFRRCTGLREITFGAALDTIGECSFYGCTGLTALDIPDSVTAIGAYAFKGCTGLTAAELGSRVAVLGESAFHTCTGLKTLTIPGSVETIGDYCFSGSWNLWQITFEGDAPAIGAGAFKGLAATAFYPAGNATWTSGVRQNYGGTITWKAQ